jgi:hypothetical protein
LAYSGDKIWAFSNNVPVASLSLAQAGDNADMFHQPVFCTAIQAAVTKMGAKAALATFKFRPVAIYVKATKQVSSLAKKMMAKELSLMKKEKAALTDTFVQCLSIAASGFNKGVFRDKAGHPIKAAMYEQLTSLGVRPSAKVVDMVFASSGDAYNKMLIEKAIDLMAKPKAVRQSLAETIDENNYLPTPTDGVDDENEDEDSMENAATIVEASVIPQVKHGQFFNIHQR